VGGGVRSGSEVGVGQVRLVWVRLGEAGSGNVRFDKM
jgi:hypothetical protein